MSIKPKQYREFYLACIRLYGLIDSIMPFLSLNTIVVTLKRWILLKI